MNSLRIFLLAFVLYSATTFAQQVAWVPFEWHSETLSGRKFDKAAMFVTVSLDGLPHKFVMQFDLGSDRTMVYGNPAKPFMAMYPELERKLSPDGDGKDKPTLDSVALRLGDVSMGKQNLSYRKGFGNRVSKRTAKADEAILIGTIGTDIFKDKVMIVDYPGKRIGIAETVPDEYKSLQMLSYRTQWGKIIVPFTINGKVEELVYDTGSSLFTLLTTAQRIAMVSASGNTDSMKLYAWGKSFWVYSRESNVDVALAGRVLSPMPLYYYTAEWNAKLYDDLKVWGLAGNTCFLKNKVLIDFVRHQICVK